MQHCTTKLNIILWLKDTEWQAYMYWWIYNFMAVHDTFFVVSVASAVVAAGVDAGGGSSFIQMAYSVGCLSRRWFFSGVVENCALFAPRECHLAQRADRFRHICFRDVEVLPDRTSLWWHSTWFSVASGWRQCCTRWCERTYFGCFSYIYPPMVKAIAKSLI